MLFALALILAGAAVALPIVLGIGSAALQTTLLISLGAVLGAGALVGLIIAVMESGGRKKRNARLQPLRDAPSALRLTLPAAPPPSAAPAGVAAQAAPPSVEIPSLDAGAAALVTRGESLPEASEPEPEPVRAPEPEPVTRTAPVAVHEPEPAAPVATLVDAAPLTEPATAGEKTLDVPMVQDEPAPEPVAPVEEAPVAVPALPPADRMLHLDPDFEMSELKRVLRIWQMTFEEDELHHRQDARWIAADGTSIDLFTHKEGYPYMEIRGPMADELAEFLPQDLPVHPVLPDGLAL